MILKDENHLFNQIAVQNNYKQLFPLDIKKTKLNDEMKKRIFKEFSFKYITDGSSSIKISKEIYNTYFGKHIIMAFYNELDKKNIHYSVDENVFVFYEFAKANLILDKVTSMTYNKISSDQEDSLEV